MSRRFIPLDQLDTLRKARALDEQTQKLDRIVRNNANERLAKWLAKQEPANA